MRLAAAVLWVGGALLGAPAASAFALGGAAGRQRCCYRPQRQAQSRSSCRRPVCVRMAARPPSVRRSRLDDFNDKLGSKDYKGCLRVLREGRGSNDDVTVDRELAARLLTEVGEHVLQQPNSSEVSMEMQNLYTELQERGRLAGYGSISMDVLPSTKKPADMTPDALESLTGVPMEALTPRRAPGVWLQAGIALFLAEYAVSTALGVDPLDITIPATAGIFLLDRIFLRGAVFESILRRVVPGYFDKIVTHEAGGCWLHGDRPPLSPPPPLSLLEREYSACCSDHLDFLLTIPAGHFLVAVLLGCPVQGCLLDPWEVRRFVAAGQGGTVFADRSFASGLASGNLSRTDINRFSIILMAGIAAEALQYGRAEGGSSDEDTLISLLSSTVPPFAFDQIQQQARWAAVQALLLLKEHRGAYDELVAALKERKDLGHCIEGIDQQLSRGPLPGDIRRKERRVSKADELRGMIEERLARASVKTAVEEDHIAVDLAQRLQQFEKLLTESGPTAPAVAVEAHGGGVWLNGLASVSGEPAAAVALPAQEQDQQKASSPPLGNKQASADREIERIDGRLREVEERLRKIMSE
jgi:hypothetical protein